jgi:hypothetical protein
VVPGFFAEGCRGEKQQVLRLRSLRELRSG